MSDNIVTVTKNVSVEVDVEVNISEIIEEMNEDQLRNALGFKEGTGDQRSRLERIYEEFRRRGDAPSVLRDYLYDFLGQTLP
jgi:hypothetical protein